ncbi:chemotaxis protein CheD [Aliikangiella sp. IMCC44359]|uniref:chemotaxis protein CheD n=1 Tax=Aliikangiella sp. IMCC44359 TaxID=3459125 RepID=UPI00403AAE39
MGGYLDNQSLFVHPGEIAFRSAPLKIETLLGSCVAITVWHPKLLVGGMCHYLLPLPLNETGNKNNYRYASYALQELVERMQKCAEINEFYFGCFGGSEMIESNRAEAVGKVNINFALNWLNEKKVRIVSQSVGGKSYRKLCLCLTSGIIDINVSTLLLEG